ncbi:MAG: hypothetical protein IT373_37630, partial [Polyangiaceae bacterium]|nr:hypothetical protein [Polyangiaceae bacterium]
MKPRIAYVAVIAIAGAFVVANCSSDDSNQDGTGASGTGAAGTGGNGTGGNGTGGNTGGNGTGGNTGGTGTGGTGTGGQGPCIVTQCTNQVYACGDCTDNDGDGLIDWADPDCLGPCSNNEEGFDLLIPGGSNTCQLDCYYDSNSGSGNDSCYWDHRCDPLEPSLVNDGCTCNPDG